MNPERTGRRVINVDTENKDFRINGELPTLLTELEFIVADMYITMLGQGFYNKDINDIFDNVRQKGIESAWKTIKLENEITGQELIKDLGGIPDYIK